MAEPKFKEGDIVQHKLLDGPKMLVAADQKAGVTIRCHWFTKAGLFQDQLIPARHLALVKHGN